MISEAAISAAAEAIKAAQCHGREGPFGHYDYSSYGWDKPHRVRDFRDPSSETWGHDVFKSDSREESWAEYERLTEEHIARAALSAALPVMLEGKREEIARLVFVAMRWAAEHSPGAGKGPAPHWVEGGNSHAQEEARDISDRIIAMLGGGE